MPEIQFAATIVEIVHLKTSESLFLSASMILFKRFLTIPSILNGVSVTSKSKIPVHSHNNEVIHHYLPVEDLAGIPAICLDSYKGFQSWSNRPFSERSQILRKAADLVEKRRQQYIDAHVEIGGSLAFAQILADAAITDIREYASLISRPEGIVPRSASTDLALTLRTPMGPVLSIAPWNAPSILWARAIVAPLAAGCSVVAKASEKAPIFPYLFVQDLLEAGVDKAALQLVHFAPEDHARATEQFLANDKIRKVNFTGSTSVGIKIAQSAATHLKPTLLELGGKNVSVICEDADLARAAHSLLLSAWLHKGQICMCLDNVYVHESVFDRFVELLVEDAKKLSANPDFAIAQRDAVGAQKIDRLVSDAVEKGATVLFGEYKPVQSSECAPIVLGNVTRDMDICTEEVFGPVLSVFTYSDVDQVVDEINSLRYGLKAAIWTSDALSAISIAKRMDFGGIHINDLTIHDESTIPHGGVKQSGSGRFNSTWGLDEFTYIKSITLKK